MTTQQDRPNYQYSAPKQYRVENYDTIKVSPSTLTRLKNISLKEYHQHPDKITFDELINELLDRVAEH